MADISKNSKLEHNYTAHCLRATTIQGMIDVGFEIRRIMHISGHKNEASGRSYNRDCSTLQEKTMSDTLAELVVHVSSDKSTNHPLSVYSISNNYVNESYTCTRIEPIPSQTPGNFALNSSNFRFRHFMSNSSFNNCVFNFGKN